MTAHRTTAVPAGAETHLHTSAKGTTPMSENTTSTAGLDLDELRTIVADALELPTEEVTDEAHFVNDLQVDSLMALEIVVNLEKRYGIKVAESDFKELTNLLQVHGLVESKLKEQANAA
ncbi:acyl carrier protein [Streptomyces sp. NPDC005279]|uniref:acyl carrier protein n=1 Tax=Streptomyces sp. NPDC005279 TaxID=3364712 RepID=UPI00367CF02E